MDTHLKQAYTYGAQQALQEAGVTKVSAERWEETEDIGDYLVPAAKFLPYAGPIVSPVLAAHLAPKGVGWNAAMASMGGGGIGALGGALGGGLIGGGLGALSGDSDVAGSAALIGALLGMVPGSAYGTYKGYQSSKDVLRKGVSEGKRVGRREARKELADE